MTHFKPSTKPVRQTHSDTALALAVVCVLLATSVETSPDVRTMTVSSRSKFKAAVYAHAVYVPLDLFVVSRSRALRNMEINLAIYMKQAARAREQGADIIVFPEDGVYGMVFTRETIYPYLEQIPDPRNETWNPCDDSGRHPDSEVQVFLSCMAKRNQLYVVANMGDKQPCNPRLDRKCPEDKRYQYNTDVAYGPDGTFLAKYHKYNLFFETQFDTPEPIPVYFDTPFGRVGLMTCFDVLFKEPGIPLVETHNVTIVAFPTAWRDALPLLPAIGFHSSFARAHRVNFLAANIHLPEFRFDGTGLYSPEGAHAVYYGTGSDGLDPKLFVAEMDVVESNSPPGTSFTNPGSERKHSLMGSSINTVGDFQYRHSKLSPPRSPLQKNVSGDTEFESILFEDEYTFRTLDQPSGKLKVCQGELCCQLEYETKTNFSKTDELFAFGAFDGLHTYDGRYYMQNCALVKCADVADRTSCGSLAFTSSTVFTKISMSGNFRSPYVYPQVVLSDAQGQLGISGPGAWYFETGSSLQTSDSFSGTVLNAILLGRDYSKDNRE